MVEQQTQQSQSPLNRVLHRLDRFSTSKPDLLQTPAERHLKDRCSSIGTFIEYWRMDRAAAAQQIRDAVDYYQKYGPEDKTAKERYQNMLVGYLFVVNRALFSGEKGSMDSYDKQKEKRQIEAVLRASNGEHLHMGTGEGKSTVVIPIAGIVESLMSARKDVVISTANGFLLDELRVNTEKFIGKLAQSEFFPDTITCTTSKGEETSHVPDPTAQVATREALSDGIYSQKTKERMEREAWGDFGKKHPDNTPQYLDVAPHPDMSRIHFATEKDLVFTYMDDPEAFASHCPKILMDEADVPYNRGTPYVKDKMTFTASPESVQEATDEWILYSMIADQVKPADIVAESGSYELSSQARSRIAKLDFDHITRNIKKDMLTYSWSESFAKSVNRLCEQTGVTFKPGEKKAFMLKMIKRMKEQYISGPAGNTDFASILTHMGDCIASMIKARERAYTIGHDGRVVVRDNYIDELLLSHKYGRDQQLAALAVAGRYELLERDVAYSSLHFQSFLHALADKLTLFSGTLMYPGALKGNIQKGSLASFIERETGRKVVLIAPPEIKKVPRPKLFDTPEAARIGLIDRLRNDVVGDNKPILVVDFSSITNAQKTYEAFVKEYGLDQVAFLPPKPSGNLKEEQEYEARLKEVTRKLAAGQIKVAVSTGAVGTGVNIVSPDGSFPDLRVAILGLPQKEQQIVQLIGRRRKSDLNANNLYYWHFSREEIDQLISIYEDDPRSGRIYLGRDDRSRQMVYKELDKVKDDPEKLLRFVIELMRVNQARVQENDKITIQFDRFYGLVSGLCEHELKQKIREEILHIPIHRSVDIESRVPEPISDAEFEKLYPSEDFHTQIPKQISNPKFTKESIGSVSDGIPIFENDHKTPYELYSRRDENGKLIYAIRKLHPKSLRITLIGQEGESREVKANNGLDIGDAVAFHIRQSDTDKYYRLEQRDGKVQLCEITEPKEITQVVNKQKVHTQMSRGLTPVDRDLTAKEKFQLDRYFDALGLPSSLFWKLQRSLHMYNPGSSTAFTNDPEQTRFQKWCEEVLAGFPTHAVGYGMNPSAISPLVQTMNDWFLQSKKEAQEYVDTRYAEFISKGFDEEGNLRPILYDKEIEDPSGYYVLDPGCTKDNDGNTIIGLGESRGRYALGYKNAQGRIYCLKDSRLGDDVDLFVDWTHTHGINVFSAASSPGRNMFFLKI